MNLIDIGIYFLVFLTGVAFLWFLARFKLIKDIKDKESKAQSIISSAKNKANRLIKDTAVSYTHLTLPTIVCV